MQRVLAMNDVALTGADDFSPSERELLAAILSGKRANLKGQTIRASVLRELAIESHADWPLPPIGISVIDATIEGELDLEGCAVGKPLVFLRCRFDGGGHAASALRLRDSRLTRVAFYESIIKGTAKADRPHVENACFMPHSPTEGMVRRRGPTLVQ